MPADYSNRTRLSHRGLPGVPASKHAAHVPMAHQVYDVPGENTSQEQQNLKAKAYPKHFWPGLPRAMQHEAMIEEFEERWQAIGTFCKSKLCRLNPRHSCDECYAKFSKFAGDELVASQL